MKKIFSLVTMLVIMLSLSGCDYLIELGNDSGDSDFTFTVEYDGTEANATEDQTTMVVVDVKNTYNLEVEEISIGGVVYTEHGEGLEKENSFETGVRKKTYTIEIFQELDRVQIEYLKYTNTQGEIVTLEINDTVIVEGIVIDPQTVGIEVLSVDLSENVKIENMGQKIPLIIRVERYVSGVEIMSFIVNGTKIYVDPLQRESRSISVVYTVDDLNIDDISVEGLTYFSDSEGSTEIKYAEEIQASVEIEKDITAIIIDNIEIKRNEDLLITKDRTFITKVEISNPNDAKINSFTFNGNTYTSFTINKEMGMEIYEIEMSYDQEGKYMLKLDAVEYTIGEDTFALLPSSTVETELELEVFTLVISNAEELNMIRDDLNGSYVLRNEILVTDGDFAQIQGDFTGTIDGRGHRIVGLTLNYPMFESLSYGSRIERINFEDAIISPKNMAAFLATVNQGTIEGNYFDINGQQLEYYGGLVGTNEGMIQQNTFFGNLKGREIYVVSQENNGAIKSNLVKTSVNANHRASGISEINNGYIQNNVIMVLLTYVGGAYEDNASSMLVITATKTDFETNAVVEYNANSTYLKKWEYQEIDFSNAYLLSDQGFYLDKGFKEEYWRFGAGHPQFVHDAEYDKRLEENE